MEDDVIRVRMPNAQRGDLQGVKRILYVEPKARNVELTGQRLAAEAPHLQLHSVSTSAEALTLLTSGNDFDLVLADLRIPDLDAGELMGEIQHRGLDVPFVLIVDGGDEDTAGELLRRGAYDYLVKRENYLLQLPYTIDHALARFHLNQTIRRINTENERQEKYLRAVVDNAVDGIVNTDHMGIIESVNATTCNIFGYTEAELVGRDFAVLLPEAYLAQHQVLMERARSGSQQDILGVVREIPGMRKDGSTFPLELAIADIDLGERRVLSAVLRDITQRKAMEDELIKAREMAERASAEKSDFLSRMSHELRTPLNSVLGYAQLIETEDLPPNVIHEIGLIIKAGRHLNNLIDELLNIARIESGRQEMSLQPVHVRDLVLDTWLLVAPMASERNIVFGGDEIGKERNDFVLADIKRLKQVMINLMSNAIKYNTDGGSVEFKFAEIRDGFGRITVIDTGLGIVADKLDYVFEPFARLDTEGGVVVEGTGIGLALCKSLINAMGGRIGVDSDPGAGSHFWVELPLIDEPENWEEASSFAISGGLKQLGFQDSSSKILNIENNFSGTQLLETVVAHFPKVGLLNCTQGRLGIELAENQRPNLILLDQHLPDIPAGDVLAQLKINPLTREIPVLIFSRDARPDQIRKLIGLGAETFISLPFNIRELIATLTKYLPDKE